MQPPYLLENRVREQEERKQKDKYGKKLEKGQGRGAGSGPKMKWKRGREPGGRDLLIKQGSRKNSISKEEEWMKLGMA